MPDNPVRNKMPTHSSTKDVVFSRRSSFGSTVLALLILAAQTTFATAGAIADAREPNSVQIHLHKPHQEHASHNPDSCEFCIAIHAGVLPAGALKVPTTATIAWSEDSPEPSQTRSQESHSLEIARAPPALV